MKKYLLMGLIILVVLSGCGGSTADTPQLSAPATRTPAPPTSAAEVNEDVSGLEVISLRPELDTFLAAAGDIGLLDQTMEFMQSIASPESCLNNALDGAQFEMLFVLGAIHWPLADFSAWQASSNSFPEAELIRQINDLAPELESLLPAGETLQVCVIPVPHFDPPPPVDPNATPIPGARWQNHPVAVKDLNAVALRGNTILVTCSAGTDCLDDVRLEVIRAASMAYQQRMTGVELAALPLLDRLIYEGRASDYLLRLEPDLQFAWTDALTAEDEAAAWHSMSFVLENVGVDFEYTNNYLYGTYGSLRYPVWAGMVIGDRVVQMYRARYPDLTWEEFAAVPSPQVFSDSGYDPELRLFNP